MTDYFSVTIETKLDCDGIFDRMESLLPDLRWRRGESEMQGARTVGGRNDLGATVKFWLYDSNTDQTEVEISLRGAEPDEQGDTAWQQNLVGRLFDEIFPDLGTIISLNDKPATVEALRQVRDAREGSTLDSGIHVVLDLNEWLPSGGEDGVSTTTVEGGLQLTVDYLPDDGGEMRSRTIVFDRAVYQLEEQVPGDTTLPGDFSVKDVRPGEVVNLGNTGFLQDWLAAPENVDAAAGQPVRHYFVMFWDMGVAIHVLAATVQLR